MHENECFRALMRKLRHGLRKYQSRVIDEVRRTYEDGGGVVIAELPTGYGKTLIPVALATDLVSDGIVSRVIHTYPTTAMIEHLLRKDDSEVKVLREAWNKCFNLPKEATSLLVGSRHMFRHESPFLTNPYVVTTLDTLIAHYMKTYFSRAQKGSGRGVYSEFSAGVIHTSLLVFDEAHMYPTVAESLPEAPEVPVLGKAFNTMAYIMGKHAEVGGVSLLMTATIPEPLLNGIKEVLARYGVSPRLIGYSIGRDDPESQEGSFLSYVKKRKFVRELREFSTDEELIKDLVKEAEELASSGRNVLCVMNTVKDAVNAYLMLKEKIRDADTRIALAHSRYTARDRQRIVDSIKDSFGRRRGPVGSVLVATQVVEASIDISADALLTDVSPLDSLAQRLGRVCRAGHIAGECTGVVRFYVNKGSLERDGDFYGPYDRRLVHSSYQLLKDIIDDNTEFQEFTVTPRRYITEAYSSVYGPILSSHYRLLDFLEQLTVRTSPALIDVWSYEEFGGFIRDEDMMLIALVDDEAFREWVNGGSEERLANSFLKSLKEGDVLKLNSTLLPKTLSILNLNYVPCVRVNPEGMPYFSKLSSADVRRSEAVGTYVLIPGERYSRELGLVPELMESGG